MRRKVTHFSALVLSAASMLVSASGMAGTGFASGSPNVPQTQGESGARLLSGLKPSCFNAISRAHCSGFALEDHAADASGLTVQYAPEPIRWPEYPREPSPRPLPRPSAAPGSSLSWSGYGRSPGGGTAPSFKRWPRAGRVYAPTYSPSPPEPVRWPEYQH